jgi:molybdate transport system permease protein
VDTATVLVTLKLACATTAILTALGLPLAYALAQGRWPGRELVETVVALPLVLPPTVLGFFLLLATGPASPLGRMYTALTGASLPFTFTGILLGSVLFNLPFAVRPFTAALAAMDRRLIEAAWCLGESRWRTFWRVTLPLCWPGILAGMVLAFAHTVGEFGVVLMMGGNIPGVTRTLSIAIYDDVQAMNYRSAAQTAGVLVVMAVLVLGAVQALSRRRLPV